MKLCPSSAFTWPSVTDAWCSFESQRAKMFSQMGHSNILSLKLWFRQNGWIMSVSHIFKEFRTFSPVVDLVSSLHEELRRILIHRTWPSLSLVTPKFHLRHTDNTYGVIQCQAEQGALKCIVWKPTLNSASQKPKGAFIWKWFRSTFLIQSRHTEMTFWRFLAKKSLNQNARNLQQNQYSATAIRPDWVDQKKRHRQWELIFNASRCNGTSKRSSRTNTAVL